MTDHDRHVADLLHSAAPTPPRALDAAAIRSAARPSRQRVVRIAAPLLAAAVVAAVAVAVVATRPDSHADRSAVQLTTAQLRGELTAITERLIADFPTPPGARVVATLPAPFSDGGGQPTDPSTITRTKRWIVNRTPTSVQRQVTKHRTAGLTLKVSSDGSRDDVFFSRAYLTDARWQPANASVPPPAVTVSVEPVGRGLTGVQVDATAFVDPRLAEQIIPTSVSGAELTISKDPAITGRAPSVIRRHLDAHDAHELAALVNAMPVLPVIPVSISCMPVGERFIITESVTFQGPEPPKTVAISGPACLQGPSATISVGARETHPRFDATALEKAVLKAAGLPADFRIR